MQECYHEAPLKIAKAFPIRETGGAAVILMDASPGLLDGDRYDMDITLHDGAHVYVTGQSFTKIHPSPASSACVDQRFRLGRSSILEYYPKPVIPYAGSRFSSLTSFHLEEGAILMFADCLTPGRTHHGDSFLYRSLSSKIQVYRKGKLIAWDHFRLRPERDHFRRPGGLEEYSYVATFWLFCEAAGLDQLLLPGLRRLLADQQPDIPAGASLAAEGGLMVRMLGSSSWRLQELTGLLGRYCRERLLGWKEAVLPGL